MFLTTGLDLLLLSYSGSHSKPGPRPGFFYGWATAAQERYYQIWAETDGPVNDSGVKAVREFYFPKVSLGGTAELAFSRTDAQTDNLEGTLVNCEDSQFFQVTDTYNTEDGD